MLALKENCIHPTSKRPYILDSSGGRDNSPEGHQVVPAPSLTSTMLDSILICLLILSSPGREHSHTRSSPVLRTKRIEDTT